MQEGQCDRDKKSKGNKIKPKFCEVLTGVAYGWLTHEHSCQLKKLGVLKKGTESKISCTHIPTINMQWIVL